FDHAQRRAVSLGGCAGVACVFGGVKRVGTSRLRGLRALPPPPPRGGGGGGGEAARSEQAAAPSPSLPRPPSRFALRRTSKRGRGSCAASPPEKSRPLQSAAATATLRRIAHLGGRHADASHPDSRFCAGAGRVLSALSRAR